MPRYRRQLPYRTALLISSSAVWLRVVEILDSATLSMVSPSTTVWHFQTPGFGVHLSPVGTRIAVLALTVAVMLDFRPL